MLAVKGMAKSTFYYHNSRKDSDKHQAVRKRIKEVFSASGGTYGYRRITLELNAHGLSVNHKTVSRLMAEMGLRAVQKKRRYRSYRGEVGHVAENIINRDFKADRPMMKATTDISQINIGEDKLYLSVLLDMLNGEVISYSMSEHPNMKLVMTMLENGLSNRHIPQGMIIHSDQGWQYQHSSYCQFLKSKNITQSMSRKGNCYDNAIMESFFGTMKSELLYPQKFKSKYEFARALENYISYYNNDRIKLRLKTSPVKYRNQIV